MTLISKSFISNLRIFSLAVYVETFRFDYDEDVPATHS